MINTWRTDVMPALKQPGALSYWLAMETWTPKNPVKHCIRQCGEYVYLPEHMCPICQAKKGTK